MHYDTLTSCTHARPDTVLQVVRLQFIITKTKNSFEETGTTKALAPSGARSKGAKSKSLPANGAGNKKSLGKLGRSNVSNKALGRAAHSGWYGRDSGRSGETS